MNRINSKTLSTETFLKLKTIRSAYWIRTRRISDTGTLYYRVADGWTSCGKLADILKAA